MKYQRQILRGTGKLDVAMDSRWDEYRGAKLKEGRREFLCTENATNCEKNIIFHIRIF